MLADASNAALPASTPLLVAGGGPVGLATAVELAHHGVASVVVERRKEVSWLRPRAKTTSARTMEHFRRWGLADRLRRLAPLPVAWSDQAVFCTSLLGREITRIDRCFGLELAGSELVAECGQQVPQPVVEHLLRQAVECSPLTRLHVGLQVAAVSEESDGVWVDVVDEAGRLQRIHADYVIGCEGARSVVRQSIGSRYQGTDSSRPNFNIVFKAPDLAAQVPHGPAVHYWVLNPGQPGLIGRLDLDETWWCIVQGVDAETGEAAPERLVHRLLGANAPVKVLATDAWQARIRLVDHYASDRLFLAGDAAHQNPPWGGHGFNAGIGDAVNIGWKLAAVMNRWAGPSLLASYEAERRPVAARTIDAAVRNMSILAPELADPGLAGTDADFAHVRPRVAAAVHHAKEGEFHSLGLTLGYDYADSPIVWEDRSAGEPVPSRRDEMYEPMAAPGHRLPHRWLAPGDSLYDHLGKGFSLLGDQSASGAEEIVTTARSYGVPLTVLDLRGEGWRSLFGAALVLVRPDQHVAWRADACQDPDGVVRRAIGHVSESPACGAVPVSETVGRPGHLWSQSRQPGGHLDRSQRGGP